jgi:hypothetical protein
MVGAADMAGADGMSLGGMAAGNGIVKGNGTKDIQGARVNGTATIQGVRVNGAAARQEATAIGTVKAAANGSAVIRRSGGPQSVDYDRGGDRCLVGNQHVET